MALQQHLSGMSAMPAALRTVPALHMDAVFATLVFLAGSSAKFDLCLPDGALSFGDVFGLPALRWMRLGTLRGATLPFCGSNTSRDDAARQARPSPIDDDVRVSLLLWSLLVLCCLVAVYKVCLVFVGRTRQGLAPIFKGLTAMRRFRCHMYRGAVAWDDK